MGYVEDNLLPNEEILYKAKIHWIIYRGVILPIIFLFFMLTDYSENTILIYIVGFFGLVGLLSFLLAKPGDVTLPRRIVCIYLDVPLDDRGIIGMISLIG